MPTTLYGIKNCDTIRKARKWLKAMQLMLAQPTMIKRPLLEHDDELFCSFSETRYQQISQSEHV